jgi:hypothetical protein
VGRVCGMEERVQAPRSECIARCSKLCQMVRSSSQDMFRVGSLNSGVSHTAASKMSFKNLVKWVLSGGNFFVHSQMYKKNTPR